MHSHLFKVSKIGIECLFDGGIIHWKYRHKLFKVAQHFMRVPD
jgi:hypothetical protein